MFLNSFFNSDVLNSMAYFGKTFQSKVISILDALIGLYHLQRSGDACLRNNSLLSMRLMERVRL